MGFGTCDYWFFPLRATFQKPRTHVFPSGAGPSGHVPFSVEAPALLRFLTILFSLLVLATATEAGKTSVV
jgi:hypothetical protein